MDDNKSNFNESSNELDSLIPKSITKDLSNILERPVVKDAIKNIAEFEEIKKIYRNFEIDNFYMKAIDNSSLLDKMAESDRKREEEKQDFLNNTRIIAESNVALSKTNEQIVKINEQLLGYNEMLCNQLIGINGKLNSLSDEMLFRSKVEEALGAGHLDKLNEIIELLKSPKDENLMKKIGSSFIDIPPQVIIALAVEALKVHLGINA